MVFKHISKNYFDNGYDNDPGLTINAVGSVFPSSIRSDVLTNDSLT